MPATLYVSHQLQPLAARLAENLQAERAASGNPFVPQQIVVPNRHLLKWLQLQLAHRNGIAANLEFLYLENGLWQALATEDDAAPVRLDSGTVRLWLLALLQDEALKDDAGLQALWEYVNAGTTARERSRRTWQLCRRLGDLLLDYECQRQDMVQHWLAGELIYQQETTSPVVPRIEQLQQRLYQLLFAGGQLRDRVAPARQTLAQWAARCTAPAAGPLHVFGLSHSAPFYYDVLLRLGRTGTLQLYHLGFARELWSGPVESVTQRVQGMVLPADGLQPCPDDPEPVQLWGEPGRETLALLAQAARQQETPLEVVAVPVAAPSGASLLKKLQQRLRGEDDAGEPVAQDRSVQLFGAPDVQREVAAVYDSILHNLHEDDTLRPTEIAVLVTDVETYLPVVRDVFGRERDERQRPLVPYSIVDTNASRESRYAQAVRALLALVDGPFTRKAVFELVFNPCFLAAVHATREAAEQWLAWAEALGIFREFAREPAGGPDWAEGRGDAFTWQQGLQRLRLGRVLALDDDGETGLGHWRGRAPCEAGGMEDADSIGQFSLVLETLADCAARFAAQPERSAAAWRQLLVECAGPGGVLIDVPWDLPEEAAVQGALLDSLEQLEAYDEAQQPSADSGLSLTLLREYVTGALQDLPAQYGRALTDGVTVASLVAMRPLPFRVVYMLGLRPGQFPGQAATSTFDLRRVERQAGDLDGPQHRRYVFFEMLMSTQDKLYLGYVNHNLQKDEEYYPCSVLVQLQRYLQEAVLPPETAWQQVEIPIAPWSTVYLEEPAEHTDLLYAYGRQERALLAEAADIRAGLQAADDAESEESGEGLPGVTALLPAAEPVALPAEITVSLAQLKGFLQDPAKAQLQRHLSLYTETDEEAEWQLAEDEPFNMQFPDNYHLQIALQEAFVRESQQGTTVDERALLERYYQAAQRQSRAAAGVYGRGDGEYLLQELQDLLQGLGALVQRLDGCDFYSRMVLGEGGLGPDAGRRFPATRIKLAAAGQPVTVRLVGVQTLVWDGDEAWEVYVPGTKGNGGKKGVPTKHALEAFLFYVALRANEAGGSDWLADYPWHIHVGYKKGLQGYGYQLTPHQARGYLQQLLQAYLLEPTFADLPLEAVCESQVLASSYLAEEPLPDDELEDAFYDALVEALAAAQERTDDHGFKPDPMVTLAGCEPPEDAHQLMQQRLGPFLECESLAHGKGGRK